MEKEDTFNKLRKFTQTFICKLNDWNNINTEAGNAEYGFMSVILAEGEKKGNFTWVAHSNITEKRYWYKDSRYSTEMISFSLSWRWATVRHDAQQLSINNSWQIPLEILMII